MKVGIPKLSSQEFPGGNIWGLGSPDLGTQLLGILAPGVGESWYPYPIVYRGSREAVHDKFGEPETLEVRSRNIEPTHGR